jgi:hypothetical protein
MAKAINILIGVGVLGVIGYYLYKNRSTSQVNLESELQKQLFPKKIKTPIVNEEPIEQEDNPVKNTVINPSTGKLITPATPLKPIVIDYSGLNPNIGSSLINMNVVSTDPFDEFQNCHTMAEYKKLKDSGQPIPVDYCIIPSSSISEKVIQENSFKMKEFKNEFSVDFGTSLNGFMQGSGGTQAGGTVRRGDPCDPYGYGGKAI